MRGVQRTLREMNELGAGIRLWIEMRDPDSGFVFLENRFRRYDDSRRLQRWPFGFRRLFRRPRAMSEAVALGVAAFEVLVGEREQAIAQAALASEMADIARDLAADL